MSTGNKKPSSPKKVGFAPDALGRRERSDSSPGRRNSRATGHHEKPPSRRASTDLTLDHRETITHGKGRSSSRKAKDLTRSPRSGAVLIFGVTGSGKSTLTSHLTMENVEIGHSLTSSTVDATAYTITHESGQDFQLIDTPGFDDTSRSEAEIFKELAWILGSLFESAIPIYGFIYLHRITDPRMGGSAMRTLRIFKDICGKQAFLNVVLVTTMWENLSDESRKQGDSRENALKDTEEFWGSMIRGGAKVMRHDSGVESAKVILETALARETHAPAQIQIEMIEEQKVLSETTAGMFILQEYFSLQDRVDQDMLELSESIQDAIENEELAVLDSLYEQQQEWEAMMRHKSTVYQSLEISFQELKEQRLAGMTSIRSTEHLDRQHSGLKRPNKEEYDDNEYEALKKDYDIIHTKYTRLKREKDLQKPSQDLRDVRKPKRREYTDPLPRTLFYFAGREWPEKGSSNNTKVDSGKEGSPISPSIEREELSTLNSTLDAKFGTKGYIIKRRPYMDPERLVKPSEANIVELRRPREASLISEDAKKSRQPSASHFEEYQGSSSDDHTNRHYHRASRHHQPQSSSSHRTRQESLTSYSRRPSSSVKIIPIGTMRVATSDLARTAHAYPPNEQPYVRRSKTEPIDSNISRPMD